MVTDALITNEIDPDNQLWIDYMSRLSFINRIIDIMAIALIITNIILLIQWYP